MSKKQLLVIALIALSLVSSSVFYQAIQNKTSDVSLAEEGFMEENVMGTNVQEIITQVEATSTQDQSVLNTLSALKNLSAQKDQVTRQIGALNTQLNSFRPKIFWK